MSVRNRIEHLSTLTSPLQVWYIVIAVINAIGLSQAQQQAGLLSIKQMSRTYSWLEHKISIVVPVYNEISIIEKFHKELDSSLLKLKLPYEIIYVDDYSGDGTYEWLERRIKGIKSTRSVKGINSAPRGIFDIKGEVRVLHKIGKKGKAYSLIQGFEIASGTIFVMIDGDLQYPPSAIPGMVKQLDKSDIVVADRIYRQVSFIRSALSWSFRYFFGKLLFSLNCDVQSGLKVFKCDVFEKVKFTPSSAWTFDLEFLQAARIAGFSIVNHKVIFSPRSNGSSKVNLILSIIEIGWNAARVKLKYLLPFDLLPG